MLLITGFPYYIISFENNPDTILKITSIYAQDSIGRFDYIFPPFDEDIEDKEGGISNVHGSIDDDSSSAEDKGNKERSNETTKDFRPLSSRPPNSFDKASSDNEVNQTIGQQSEQDVKDISQSNKEIGQLINQTIGNEVNQTEEQQSFEQILNRK